MSHTALDGKVVMRVAMGNVRTRQQNMEELWGLILNILNETEANRLRSGHLEFGCQRKEDGRSLGEIQRSDGPNEMDRQAS